MKHDFVYINTLKMKMNISDKDDATIQLGSNGKISERIIVQ